MEVIYENSFVGNCIIRLNSDGTIKNMRYSDNKIEFLKATKDGGYFIGINTSGSNIKIEDRSITNSGYCYVLVKYNSNHEIEWISKESLDHTTNGITDEYSIKAPVFELIIYPFACDKA